MTLAQYFTDMGISSSKPKMTKDDSIIKRVWDRSGGVFMRGRKLSRMKRGKVYCLQLPPDEPTLPACDNIDTKGNRQKASWFLFVVNNIENMVRLSLKNMVRLSLKNLCDFFFIFQTAESLGGETGGRSWS